MKKILKVLVAMGVFFYLSYLTSSVVLKLFYNTTDTNTLYAYADFAYELGFAFIMIVMYWSKLKTGFKKLIKMFKESRLGAFFEVIIKGYIIYMLVNILINLVVVIISFVLGIEASQAENQELVEQLLATSPFLMALSACILAPFAEELLFRGAISEVIKNKRVFITVSGLIFGLMHVTDNIILILGILLVGTLINWIISNNKYNKKNKILLSVTVLVIASVLFGGICYIQNGNLITFIKSINTSEALASITYITAGCFLAYYYQKYDNIWVNIGIHFIINTVSTLVLLFF